MEYNPNCRYVDFRVKRGQITWIELCDDSGKILMKDGCFRHIFSEELDRQIAELEAHLARVR